MNMKNLKKLIDKINNLESDMELEYLRAAPIIRFSNTGRRTPQKKYFDISVISLKQTLTDMKDNFEEFKLSTKYDEGTWRDLFLEYITDTATNAMSTVQTLPLFTLINKILYAVNGITKPFDDKKMFLSKKNLMTAINFLDTQIPEDVNLSIFSQTAGQGENIIFYGAPGTGKSYAIDQLINDRNAIRTVFHPDTSYSDFIGCLKPSMNGDNIQYSFKAGPFIEALILALNDSEQHYFLIIEELNRAPAAAVFGDVFQLLDRNAQGQSSYSINIIDTDLKNHLDNNLTVARPDNKLRLPANLSIYATMNSSDQAVMPLDTAFKRRWQFEYKKLDFSTSAEGGFELSLNDEPTKTEWRDFALSVNKILSDHSIPEDRHLGPWFVNSNEISDPDNARNTLTGKVFMYLWDDVLRHGKTELIFNSSIKTYGELINEYENSQPVLSSELTALIIQRLQNFSKEFDSNIPENTND